MVIRTLKQYAVREFITELQVHAYRRIGIGKEFFMYCIKLDLLHLGLWIGQIKNGLLGTAGRRAYLKL